MEDEALYSPKNQEQDPRYNREPGIQITPGSNYAKYMESFEQFPSKFGNSPGNPYKFREFPQMLYRAEKFQGQVRCMATPPDSAEYTNMKEWEQHVQLAERFTKGCQLVVKDEVERSRAFELGWRADPAAAVEFALSRDRAAVRATAERNYEDRGMTDKAKAEKKAIEAEAGLPIAEIPEQPRQKRKYTRRTA